MQKFVMDKKDSVDFINRVELLLKLMTNGCTKDSENSNDSDNSFSSDESGSESDGNDDICPDSNDDCVGNLNKFFEDVEDGKKHLPSTLDPAFQKGIRFQRKMYRVIPIKLDEKVFKSRQPVASNRT